MTSQMQPAITPSSVDNTIHQFAESSLVDADHKSYTAQLTVALQLNQGIRQWPYIIAGVLFFVSFFCTSKRKKGISKKLTYKRSTPPHKQKKVQHQRA